MPYSEHTFVKSTQYRIVARPQGKPVPEIWLNDQQERLSIGRTIIDCELIILSASIKRSQQRLKRLGGNGWHFHGVK